MLSRGSVPLTKNGQKWSLRSLWHGRGKLEWLQNSFRLHPKQRQGAFWFYLFWIFFFEFFFGGKGSINSDSRGKIYSALKVLKELHFRDEITNSKKGDQEWRGWRRGGKEYLGFSTVCMDRRDLSKICLKLCPFRNARKRFLMWKIDHLVIYHLSLAVHLSCMVFLSE